MIVSLENQCTTTDARMHSLADLTTTHTRARARAYTHTHTRTQTHTQTPQLCRHIRLRKATLRMK